MTNKIDYVEFASPNFEETQKFFSEAFGWSYVQYGDNYADIKDAGTGGGIERAALSAPLIVLDTEDLEATYEAVKNAGAEITKEIFSFPGGRRFQFKEPGGNEMAVWSQSPQE